MTNPIIYPNSQYQQYPNQYSGVTINVTNPMMNAYPNGVSSQHPYGCNCNACQSGQYVNSNYQQAMSQTQSLTQPQMVNNQYVQYPQAQEVHYLEATRRYQPYEDGYVSNEALNYNQKPMQSDVQYLQPQLVQPVYYAESQAQAQGLSQAQSGQVQPSQQASQAYPAQYYLNNYNILPGGVNNNGENNGTMSSSTYPYAQPVLNNEQVQPVMYETPVMAEEQVVIPQNTQSQSVEKIYNRPETGTVSPVTIASYQTDMDEEPVDMTVSQNIINELDARAVVEKEKEANKEKMEVVALTNEYIKSLENYLDNPNKDIRLMAAKEILTRLNEDRDRYDDAALNALLNKMMQDPDKLVRVAAMSAFSSGLACGNEFTVKLLKDIQGNPEASEDDALEAANILLKMSETKETKYVNVEQPKVQE